MPKPSRKGISASKRLRQSIAARDRNRSVKSRTRTVINKALVAVGNDASSAEDAVRDAISALDKAAQKGVIHANAAARSKSRLLKRFNLGVASSVAAAAGAASEPSPEPESEKPAPRRRNSLARRSTEEKKPPAPRAAKEGGTTRAPRSTGRRPTTGG